MTIKQLQFFTKGILALSLTLSASNGLAQQTTTTANEHTIAIGTSKTWGTVDGVKFTGLVYGPSSAVADLQVACVFEYTEDDIFKSPPALPAASNGLVHLDEALKGRLTELRKNREFDGHFLETFYLDLPKGTIPGKKLLLIGLGNRDNFNEDIMTAVGRIATREALKLGVGNFAFASDLKDAGIASGTALVAGNVVKGIVNEYKLQNLLKSRGLTKFKPLKEVYLLAGPAFFEVAGEGIKEAIASFSH
ncbi:M17 family peptidase N-terminal domain-containing protein [Chitinophaga flava]|uniref:Peptidase M17 n=1 Tax=Chitinophaga flava TaxID=2259036 RepID=A0A365Y060_9BACT|nr:M17 family peptidase N-terminal domain-containing protein [Chitinophaga flava]RBL91996.1 peptidase M17 [Chitinophaga flava]